uniref:Kinesin-like protein n=1 Tax=Callorhinchus milii TaxID=7868 RepID=A0A4W3GJD6_CALMI
ESYIGPGEGAAQVHQNVTRPKGLSYEERLHKLRLYSLEFRRWSSDLIEVFKMIKGFNRVDTEKLFPLVRESKTRCIILTLQPGHLRYVTQMVEVESPTTLRSLRECEERNRHLLEQVTHQGERCCQLEHQLRSSQETSSQLKYKVRVLYPCLEILQSECLNQRLTTMQPFLRSMKSDYNSLRSQVKSFSQFYEAAIIEAKKQVRAQHRERETHGCFPLSQDLSTHSGTVTILFSGNIRVLCRIKPLIQTDKKEEDTPTPVTLNPANDCRITVLYKARERSFELDKVFIPEATQEVVFEEIEPLVTSCIDGYNICIFAYGQTGSGKTYTMEGETDNPGINQRALRALFKEIETRTGTWSYTVSLNLVEIYNEHLRDLLGKDPQEKLEIKLNPDGSGHLHVPGLTLVEVKRFQDIRKVLALGRKNRVTQSTNMNERSSRSHVLLTVTVSGTEINTDTKTVGKMNLVDLAGSERVWKSGAEGERLKEAQNINKSLLALADVIQALRAKQNHVPFRNSKLTYLLQDSLGKGNKTVMVVQISSLEENVGETMCSLKFAQRVCKVELGPAARRVEATSYIFYLRYRKHLEYFVVRSV